ncbi:MAG: dihydroorotate dehydrogenase-like protein [bacterium]
MNLQVKYMGLTLENPIIISSSSLTASVEKIKKLADNGAGGIVLKSLFEEQIITSPEKLYKQEEMYFWYKDAIDQVNSLAKEEGVENYLKLIKEAKESVPVPIIASINCITPNEWPSFAAKIEEAGADGIELNIFIPPTNPLASTESIEKTYFDIINEVSNKTSLPIGIKISPFFTSLSKTIIDLSGTNVKGIVLFNRYYTPDIDIENLSVISNNVLSSPMEYSSSLRWISLLNNQVKCDLAASTGIHDSPAIIKQILAGASAVEIASVLYSKGIDYLVTLLKDLQTWMKKHNYQEIADFKGKVSQLEENQSAFERVQFMRKTAGKYV